MANQFNIPEVLMIDLATASADVNLVGATLSDGDGNDVIARSVWNQVATVRVTDHPADGAGDETETDPSTFALFTNDALLNEWVLGGAERGNVVFSYVAEAGITPDIPANQNLVNPSIILPVPGTVVKTA